jgi:hypothetical protein
LNDVPLDLVFDTVRVNDQATILRDHNTRDAHDARGSINRYKSDTGYDGLIVFIVGESQAPAINNSRLLCAR